MFIANFIMVNYFNAFGGILIFAISAVILLYGRQLNTVEEAQRAEQVKLEEPINSTIVHALPDRTSKLNPKLIGSLKPTSLKPSNVTEGTTSSISTTSTKGDVYDAAAEIQKRSSHLTDWCKAHGRVQGEG